MKVIRKEPYVVTLNLSGYFVEYSLENCHETGVLSQRCSNERCSFIFKVLFCNKEQQLMTASNPVKVL